MKTTRSIPALMALVLLLTLAVLRVNAQTGRSGTFAGLWKQADSLEGIGQPRSALAVVDAIYRKALSGGDDPQAARAILFRLKLRSGFAENFMEDAIRDLNKEIAASHPPLTQVLQSVLAEVYWQYLRAERYRIANRSRTTLPLPDSVGTWDAYALHTAALRTFLLSLNRPDSLGMIPVTAWESILDVEVFAGRQRDSLVKKAAGAMPTLYDFLAGRALDFLTSDDLQKVLPSGRFELDKPWYFAQPFAFSANRMLIPADTAAPASFALRIFRDLAAFHLKDQDDRALIGWELQRFAFVHARSVIPDKDSLYLLALQQFNKARTSSPNGTLVSYALASQLQQQGMLYRPLAGDAHKWDLRDAIAVCDDAARRFPTSEGAGLCRVLAGSIRKQQLDLTTETAIPPGQPSLALAGGRNLSKLHFRIVKTDPEKYRDRAGRESQEAMFSWLASQAATAAWSVDLPDDGDFQQHSQEIPVPETGRGFHMLVASADPAFSDPKQASAYSPFWSSQIAYIERKTENGGQEYHIMDRVSGMPLKKAGAELWERNYDYRERSYRDTKVAGLTADEQGFLVIRPAGESRNRASQYLKIFWKEDMLITDGFYTYPVRHGEEPAMVQTAFYTDRAIYRPGQTIHFKGIVTVRTGDQTRIKSGHATRVVFNDVNGRKIAEQSLTTNAYGSFSGTFIAPSGVLNGSMSIANETGMVSVLVEEYRRPTFEVTCAPMEGLYMLGDAVRMPGKALNYAGNPVSGAAVKYRVVRTARYPYRDFGWWWPMPVSPEVEIVSGVTVTGPDGAFNVPFKALPDLAVDKGSLPVFDYRVSVDVTDLNGETQLAGGLVSAGYRALLLEASLPAQFNLAKDSAATLKVSNLAGRKVPAWIYARVERLTGPGRLMVKRMWDHPDRYIMTEARFAEQFPDRVYRDEDNPETWKVAALVMADTLQAMEDSILVLNQLSPGKVRSVRPWLVPGAYRLVLEVDDPSGERLVLRKNFTVFAPGDKSIPVTTCDWFVPLKETGEPGEQASFLVGSGDPGVQILCEVRLRDSLVSREVHNPGGRSLKIDIPIREEYRGNFAVNFLFVRANRPYQHSRVVRVPYPDRRLDIRMETFRDRLVPGTRETWKLRILRPSGTAASAELMAGMYDASLDVFRSNEWFFYIRQRFDGISPWDADNTFRSVSGHWQAPWDMEEVPQGTPELRLNWFGTGFFGGYPRHGRYDTRMVKGGRMEVMDAPMTATALETEATGAPEAKGTPVQDDTVQGNQADDSRPAPVKATPVAVRRDLRETAFFFPVIETNTAGEAVIEFTAPESLTRWNFMGLAHTKDLEYGTFRREVTTRKDLMVFPNFPRFVRQGDTLVISAKVVNQSEGPLSGNVTLLLSDGITQTPAALVLPASPMAGEVVQEFSLKAGQVTAISWRLAVPSDATLSLLQFRVVADAGHLSDGEEKAVPVLTNRTLVTESLPLPVSGKGTTSFSFEKLLKSPERGTPGASLKNWRLTLEFASNPAWYAIQALPSLNDRTYETADAIFAAYWSNSMAAHIANSDPKIRAVFEAWKALTPDALLSNLEKNQDLKTALLQETPWVADAAGETGRKQKLGLYFDADNIAANIAANLRKIMELQTPSGGWTWLPGMPENRYITQEIITGLGKLHHLGVADITGDPEVSGMVRKALQYMDGELEKDYENLKRYSPKDLAGNHLGSLQVQYLYARSLFGPGGDATGDGGKGIPAPGSEAYRYYMGQAEKYWLKQDIHLQGMIALTLHRAGRKDVPALVIRSLSEKASHSKEMGMYWAGASGFSWYQAPVETQAVLIEAFDEVAGDGQSVEAMKVWLLKQKQTQQWRSPRATLEACYALLLRGTRLLAEDPEVMIRVGKETIDSRTLSGTGREAGTGYFRVSWSGGEIYPGMGEVTVTTSGTGTAWGALYWQYFEDMDRVTPAATPLRLEKKLFREVNTPSGPVLEPLSAALATGDKLVARIVVTCDRDLEFVHMKDLRASTLEPGQQEVQPSRWATGRESGGSSGQLSGYRYQDGLGYYQSMTDQAAGFFFDRLPKGTYVFEYPLKVNAAGDCSNGITVIQCHYAPEFSAHSEGVRIRISP